MPYVNLTKVKVSRVDALDGLNPRFAVARGHNLSYVNNGMARKKVEG